MTTPSREIVRLDSDSYAALAARFGEPIVTDKTTELQAGFQLGVQAVLTALRQGFVIGGR